VFQTLLKKLEEERSSLGGEVFDVLGKVCLLPMQVTCCIQKNS
jgi:hypothetical protein